MPLPEPVLTFLNENAERAGSARPGPADDLFAAGALDSFALVEFVALLEEQTGITVPDADINPANFRSVEQIERYVGAREGR